MCLFIHCLCSSGQGRNEVRVPPIDEIPIHELASVKEDLATSRKFLSCLHQELSAAAERCVEDDDDSDEDTGEAAANGKNAGGKNIKNKKK